MDSVQIVKALAKAGRRDLAEAAATDYEEPKEVALLDKVIQLLQRRIK
jgi:hypothetical protein